MRSRVLRDAARERELPIETWYPAEEGSRGRDLHEDSHDRYRVMPAAPEVGQHAVRDAEAEAGRFPLVVFSHGWGGHRRQTTHLCTHLASHGYAVVAVDHTGNTLLDMMMMVAQMRGAPEPPDAGAVMGRFAEDRPRDASFVIDRALAGDAGLSADQLDGDRVAITGHSFGGWTTLATAGRDARVRAALPLAPAGGSTPLTADGPNPLADALDLEWDREVPVLYLVAEHDTLLPLDGIRELYERTPGARGLVVLRDADHMHFCDRVEETHQMFQLMGSTLSGGIEGGPDFGAIGKQIRPMSELCPGEHAYAFTCGLGLAHFDAHVRDSEAALAWLDDDIESLLSERGIAVSRD